jgi:hypothetical protein
VLTTMAMLYHVRVAETSEISGDNFYSEGKISTLLYDLYSVQYPHFSCVLKVSMRIKGEKFDFFFLLRVSRYRF